MRRGNPCNPATARSYGSQSWRSRRACYRRAYRWRLFSDLEELINKYSPTIWIHGHTHHCVQDIVGKRARIFDLFMFVKHFTCFLGWVGDLSNSVGHYFDLWSAILALTSFPAGYLLQAFTGERRTRQRPTRNPKRTTALPIKVIRGEFQNLGGRDPFTFEGNDAMGEALRSRTFGPLGCSRLIRSACSSQTSALA